MSLTLLFTMLLAFAFSISIAVAIGGSAMLGIALFDPERLILAPKEMFTAIDKFPLAAIPFFILAGNLMETGGISRRLVDFAKSLVGGVQGGLPMTCVLTCMIFAAVSGSSVATTFAIGAILIPALVKHGYPTTVRGRAAGHIGRAGRGHSAVDPDDPVRRQRRGVHRRAVHRRHRPGPADRRGADAVCAPVLPLEGLGPARRRRPPGRGHRPRCRPALRC